MAHVIKENTRIQPLQIYGFYELLSQFADDTQIYEEDDIDSLNAVAECMKTVHLNVGLETNYEKSSIHVINGTDIAQNARCADWVFTEQMPTILGIDSEQNDSQLFALIDKACTVLSNWRNRTLSLMGKVLIINVLIASLFVYVLQVVNDPPVVFYETFDNVILEYIWEGKKPKIPLSVLQLNKKVGGLGLVNMRAKVRSLKIAWLFRIDSYIEKMTNLLIPSELGSLFWDCILDTNDLQSYINQGMPIFWKEICYHWFDFKKDVHPISVVSGDQIIWCNSLIRVNSRPLYDAQLIKNGLIYVQQLMDDDGAWLSKEYVAEQYRISWFRYFQIREAIASNYKCIPGKPSNLYDEIRKFKRKVHTVYFKIMDRRVEQTMSNIYAKMSQRFQINPVEVAKAFSRIYSTTNIVKFRDFQYRLLTGNIYANNQLYYWGKVSSQRCNWCDYSKQNIQHMLFDCAYVTKIWYDLFEYVNECKLTETPIEFNNIEYKDIFLNTVIDDKHHVVNMLTLIAKQYIFACKCLGKSLSSVELFHNIARIQRIEKYNAICSDTLMRHNVKWNNCKTIVTNEVNLSDFVQEYVSNV